MITCKFCQSPVPQPESGRPKEFCSAAHRVAFNRANKSTTPEPESNTSKALQKLKSMSHHKAVTTYPPHLYAYMPTENDANISALIKGQPIPFPDHNARPITSVTMPPIDDSPPTF